MANIYKIYTDSMKTWHVKHNIWDNDLKFSTDKCAHTVDTDQSQHCLPFCLQVLDALFYGKT